MSAASDRKKATTKTTTTPTATAAGNNTKKALQSGYKGTSSKSTGTTGGSKSTGSSMAGNSYSAAVSGTNKTGTTTAAGNNTKKQLQSGYKGIGTTGSGNTSGAANSTSAYSSGTGTAASSGGSSYNNGGLTADQIREMQSYYGATADGLWGANSTASAGGLSAQEAWSAYQDALAQQEQEDMYQELYQQLYEKLYGNATGTGTDLGSDMSWEDYYAQVGANDYQQKVQDAVNAQVQQAVDDYNAQIEQAGTGYEEAARRAYVNKMLSQRNMDQELAASGVYGGMADSQRIATEAEYQNSLMDLETQYGDTIDQLKQAITNAQLSGDAQVAEMMANYLSQVQSQYSDYLAQRQSERAAAALAAQQAAAEASLLSQKNSYSGSAVSSGGTSGGYYTGDTGGSTVETATTSLDTGGAGIDDYASLKNNILMLVAKGDTSMMQSLLNNRWAQMSATQRNDLETALAARGYSLS